MNRKLIFFLIFATIFTIFEEQSMALNEQKIEKYKLDNGLDVILEPNNSSPVVAVNVWVKTGSACESEGEYGLAHVHEHMLFKGTDSRAVGEIARTIEAGGGDINAFTSFDETVYYVVSASRFLESTLDILADVMQNSTFDKNELSKELEVVLEEIRRGEDSPGRVLSQKMFATAYTKHSYKRPIIGTKESVKSFTREGILNFYSKWYSPQNMVLVVVGDFDKEKIVSKIDSTFGKLIRKEIPECSIPKEPNQKELKIFVIEKDINEGYFSLAFHIPNAKHEDTPVLDIIGNIVGVGNSSRLFRNIKEEKGLVNSIYSYSFTPKHDGLFMVGGTVDPPKVLEAKGEIVKELYRLKYEPVSFEELNKAKVNIESDSIYAKETMQGQAQKLGFFEVEAGDFNYEKEYLNKIAEVTQEDIIRVANKYFINTNLTSGVLLPDASEKVNSDQIKSTLIESSKTVEKELKDLENVDGEDVKKYVLDNGIRVLIKENHSVPIFSARAVFLGGLRYENESNNGISNILSEMFTRGTKSRSAEDIAREIDSLAGEIDGFSGRNSLGVNIEALSKNFGQAMDIFADVILNPSFADIEIARAKKEITSAINRQEDNLVRKTINLFLENLYKVHPYRFNTLGRVNNIEAFTKKDLIDFYGSVIKPENLVISVVGNINQAEVLKIVKENFGSMKVGDFDPIKLNNEFKSEDIREVVEFENDKAQTHIILGFLGPDLMDEDLYAFEVLNSVLAGQGGRLFLELRDKKSLAYTVTSFLSPGIENGFFAVYIGTAPDKENEAVVAIKEQINLLLEKGISDSELERAQNYIVGNFEISLQQNSSQASNWHLMKYMVWDGMNIRFFLRKYIPFLKKMS